MLITYAIYLTVYLIGVNLINLICKNIGYKIKLPKSKGLEFAPDVLFKLDFEDNNCLRYKIYKYALSYDRNKHYLLQILVPFSQLFVKWGYHIIAAKGCYIPENFKDMGSLQFEYERVENEEKERASKYYKDVWGNYADLNENFYKNYK